MNKKLCLFILIMFVSFRSFTQHRLQFTTEIAQSYRHISVTDASSLFTSIKNNRNNREKPKTVISYGLEYGYPVHKNTTIISGIGYAGFGYWQKDAKAEDLRWPSQINNSGAGSPETFDLKIGGELKYFSIPLAVMYEQKLSNKFSVFVRGGVGFDFFSKTKSIIIVDDDRKTSYFNDPNDFYRDLNLHTDMRVGGGYHFHKNMLLQMAYQYKSQPFSANKTGNLHDYMYNHGLSFSYVWVFTKR